jgi:hypothetical protein
MSAFFHTCHRTRPVVLNQQMFLILIGWGIRPVDPFTAEYFLQKVNPHVHPALEQFGDAMLISVAISRNSIHTVLPSANSLYNQNNYLGPIWSGLWREMTIVGRQDHELRKEWTAGWGICLISFTVLAGCAVKELINREDLNAVESSNSWFNLSVDDGRNFAVE